MRNERGVTLVEVIIGLALLSGAIMTATASFIAISRLQQKSATVRTVQQNGRFVMDDIIRNIRNSTTVTLPALALTPGSCITLAGGTEAAALSRTYAFTTTNGLFSNTTGSCTIGAPVATGDTRITAASFRIGQPSAGSKQFVDVDLTVQQGDTTIAATDPYAYKYDLTTSIELREQP